MQAARTMRASTLSESEYPHEQETDQDLVARIGSQDRLAVADLYARYQRPLFRYLCQMTPDRGLAEEILQDTLVAVWRGAASFEARSAVRTWLFAIARRQAHNAMRRRGLAVTDDDEALEALVEPE